MNHRLLAGVLTALLVLALPGATLANDRIRTMQPGPDAAQLSGSPPLRNQDIFEVRFIEINGNTISPREFIWLAPGTYRIRVVIDAAHTRPPQRRVGPRRDDPSQNVIELELEAGKTYEIRGRFNRNNPEQPYTVILHQVRDN